jgi:Domain of unknown function (DUF4340)
MAMKTEQKIYTATGILVVLLGGLWFAQKSARDDAMAHSLTAASASLPDIKLPADDADKVTKIEIHNAGKGDVALEKQGETWKLTKPVDYPANQQNVKTLIDNIKEIRVKDSIDTGKSQYATYDLEDDKAVHVQLYKDTTKAVDLYFGKSGTRGQMTRVADKDGVYVASGYSNYLYTREVKDWRDREVLKFEDGNVISVGLANANGVFSFSKGSDDKWTGTFKSKQITGFDPEKVKDMLRAYKALSADDFAEPDKSPADTGLDKPAVVAFKMKDEGGTIKLNVGKEVTGKGRYAMKEGSPTVFVLSTFVSDWAVAAESKFQKPEAVKDGGAAAGGKGDGGAKKHP